MLDALAITAELLRRGHTLTVLLPDQALPQAEVYLQQQQQGRTSTTSAPDPGGMEMEGGSDDDGGSCMQMEGGSDHGGSCSAPTEPPPSPSLARLALHGYPLFQGPEFTGVPASQSHLQSLERVLEGQQGTCDAVLSNAPLIALLASQAFDLFLGRLP